MKVAVIRYNAGNVKSVCFALDRLGVEYQLTADPEMIRSSDKVIFPGVGEASSTMRFLADQKLDEVIRNLSQPVLGICLGMQLMCRFSEENNTPCIGIFEEEVKRFPATADAKVPHMGWNKIEMVDESLIDSDLSGEEMYFVHSYYVPVNKYTIAVTTHGLPFSAAIRKGNFFGVQFHPEKSAEAGEQLIKNFLSV